MGPVVRLVPLQGVFRFRVHELIVTYSGIPISYVS